MASLPLSQLLFTLFLVLLPVHVLAQTSGNAILLLDFVGSEAKTSSCSQSGWTKYQTRPLSGLQTQINPSKEDPKLPRLGNMEEGGHQRHRKFRFHAQHRKFRAAAGHQAGWTRVGVQLHERKFKLSMQLDGNLVLYTVATISDLDYFAYWASDTVGNGSKLVFNQSGYIYVLLKNGNLRYLTTEGVVPMPMRSYYQRATC
ncbi:hypothetical protein ACLOJK_017450 [Asimina triloba]